MKLRSRALFTFATILAVSCGKIGDQSTSDLSYKLYDPHEYRTLLINKVDNREIKVFVIGEENLLFENIAKAITAWTAPLPTGSIKTRFVTSLSESDLVVEVVSPLAGRRQFTTLMPNNRPVITMFDNHNKTVLLHEMGHAFGMNDTYVAFHDGKTGQLTSTCDLYENQPDSLMCLGGNGLYKLYPDDIQGIQSLYANRLR